METKFWHQPRTITPLKNNEKFVIVLTYILSVSMHLQNFIIIHQLVHKILSINEISISIKGYNSVENDWKYCSITQIWILSISMQIQNLIEIHKLIHKILSINKILTSIEIDQKQRALGTTWILYLSMHIQNFYQNSSIYSEDIEEKHIFKSIKGHNSVVYKRV